MVCAQPPDRLDLATRKDLGHDCINAQLVANGLRGAGVVASDHRYLQAQLVQGPDSLRGGRLDRISHGHHSSQPPADGRIERGLALCPHSRGPFSKWGHVQPQAGHVAVCADLHRHSARRRGHTEPGF